MRRIVLALLAVLIDTLWLLTGWMPGWLQGTAMLATVFVAAVWPWAATVGLAGAVTLAVTLGQLGPPPAVVAKLVIFVALPLVVGRYLAQNRRLVATLEKHNRQLRHERELVAERERLLERLRIARDMHDSLGHRLSLVSVQAAALEVSGLPEKQHEAVRLLAGAARKAADELHELVGALRRPDPGEPGLDEIADVLSEFQAAGVPVTVQHKGIPRSVETGAGQAAYRVIEEGLTNAVKHAPGEQVTVTLVWEPDALLVNVVNGLRNPGEDDEGHGLAGLAERVRLAGGLLHVERTTTEFRLSAMLPGQEQLPDDADRVRRMRRSALLLGSAVAVVVLASGAMLVGPA